MDCHERAMAENDPDLFHRTDYRNDLIVGYERVKAALPELSF